MRIVPMKVRVLARILKPGAQIGNCQIFGLPIFQGRPKYSQVTTINMYLFIEIRHIIPIMGIVLRLKNLKLTF